MTRGRSSGGSCISARSSSLGDSRSTQMTVTPKSAAASTAQFALPAPTSTTPAFKQSPPRTDQSLWRSEYSWGRNFASYLAGRSKTVCSSLWPSSVWAPKAIGKDRYLGFTEKAAQSRARNLPFSSSSSLLSLTTESSTAGRALERVVRADAKALACFWFFFSPLRSSLAFLANRLFSFFFESPPAPAAPSPSSTITGAFGTGGTSASTEDLGSELVGRSAGFFDVSLSLHNIFRQPSQQHQLLPLLVPIAISLLVDGEGSKTTSYMTLNK
mmetsp:Transcript_36381/g.77407  ORF Transcript_36381/g.77407 Transcript_36381/m.77407 type:complete len:271 (-) Transcript_36381:2-814(-)